MRNLKILNPKSLLFLSLLIYSFIFVKLFSKKKGISLGKRSVIYYLSKKYFCQVPILIYDKKKSAWLSQKDILMQW